MLALAIASTGGAGLVTELEAVAQALRDRDVRLAVVGNLVLLPLVAWGLGRALGLGPAGLGLVLVAAAPGGSTGPLMALLARGDGAVATAAFAALNPLGSLGALVATATFPHADLGRVALTVALITAVALVPMLLGLLVRRRWPTVAARLAPWLSRAGLALLLIVIVALFARHHAALRADASVLAAAIVVVLSLAPALGVRGRARALAIAQVGGVRNLTLALVVVVAVDAPPPAVIAILSYGLVMYAVTGAVALVAAHRGR